jgi:YD repeat-containing protein
MTNPDAKVFTYLYDADGQLVREILGTDPTTQAVT